MSGSTGGHRESEARLPEALGAGGRPRYGLGKATFTCREGRLRVWSGAVDARATSPRRSRYCGLSATEIRRRVLADQRPVVCATRYAT